MRIGELGIGRVCGGRPWLGEACLARACESFALGAGWYSVDDRRVFRLLMKSPFRARLVRLSAVIVTSLLMACAIGSDLGRCLFIEFGGAAIASAPGATSARANDSELLTPIYNRDISPRALARLRLWRCCGSDPGLAHIARALGCDLGDRRLFGVGFGKIAQLTCASVG